MYRLKLRKMSLLIFILCLLLSGPSVAQEAAPAAENSPAKTEETQPKSESILETPLTGGDWQISGSKIFWSVFFLLAAFLVLKYTSRLLETLGERWPNFRLAIKRIIPIYHILSWTIVLYIVIAWILAPPIETLVAVTASAGIAIGFASQDILKNIFGGIMIIFDRPFQVGDKIQVGNHYGEVVQIGLRTVRLVTPDDSLVSVPNGELVNQSLSNSNSGEFNCQVVAEVFLPVHVDLMKVKNIARQAAMVSRFVYLKKPVAVIIKNEVHEGKSLYKVRIKAYVNDLRNEFAFASDMTEIFMQTLLNKGLVSAQSLDDSNVTI